MPSLISFIFLLAVASVKAHKGVMSSEGHSRSVEFSICGAQEPSDALKSIHAELNAQSKLRKVKPRDPESFTIDTHFHYVVTVDDAAVYTPEKRTAITNAQLVTLNEAYAPSNIAFNLRSTTFTVNDIWATLNKDTSMKSDLRTGSYSTLNVYFQSNLTGSWLEPGTNLLGQCALPETVNTTTCSNTGRCTTTTSAPTDFSYDGCEINLATVPGGSMQHFNQGKTAVHEIGHWFGLMHTFTDETCNASDSGDMIDDTPQEATPTDGCPTAKDSCPGSAGLDPVANYMDYSYDECMTEFSPGQSLRMAQIYKKMRSGN
ncbi:MAG: hypothetical protein Q9220_003066 [cf. Caloplaca sp. 1 TL-2023]